MPVEYCPRCSQITTDSRADEQTPWVSIVCQPCRDADRQPQGEAVRLFTPAPTQIPGQAAMDFDSAPYAHSPGVHGARLER